MTVFYSLLQNIGNTCFEIIEKMGAVILFALKSLKWAFRRPFRPAVFLQQMEFIGVKSIGIILLVGLFSGAVFALQTGNAFRTFNAETLVGSTVAIALARELAPVFTALMVVARAGSAMSAQLGTMVVTEQIEAMSAMAVNPIQYLVVPRIVAGVTMVPLLTCLFNGVGILGAYLVGVKFLEIPEGPFLKQMDYFLDASDLMQGLVKAAVFGFTLTVIATYRGLATRGGAEGVGRATTQAVVVSSVTILVLDYFLTTWILEFFPKF
ncbi:MAG: ABC transporter permease [Deltaproteobacteria bacterium]|nr:ABC transporter permease [Deltaproteobacteria bacterium]